MSEIRTYYIKAFASANGYTGDDLASHLENGPLYTDQAGLAVDVTCEIAALRSALAAAESTSLRYLTERDDWFAAYQRAEEGRRAAERERDEALAAEEWLAFASMREERDAAASDAAFRLELLRAVVATGTKDPRLDARIAEEVGR